MRRVMAVMCTLVLMPMAGFSSVGSELDSVTRPPKLIVKKLDPQTKIVTTYKVDVAGSSGMHPDRLRGLSETERNSRITAFLDSVVKPENKIAEEKVTRVRSELDSSGSTSAWWWHGHGGYYGYPYYANYGYHSYYYYPYWGYSSYGYYPYSYYGGYYGGYYNSYYPYYTYYGCW